MLDNYYEILKDFELEVKRSILNLFEWMPEPEEFSFVYKGQTFKVIRDNKKDNDQI